MKNLLWVDVETTGLEPSVDQILEIALVKTDMDLNEISTYQSLITPSRLDLINVDKEVREMHNKSGLWEELFSMSPKTKDRVRGEIDLWIYDNFGGLYSDFKKETAFAGSSVHFDLNFLEKKEILFTHEFSYKRVDVSSFRTMFSQWGVSYLKSDAHRALNDVRDSINELKSYSYEIIELNYII